MTRYTIVAYTSLHRKRIEQQTLRNSIFFVQNKNQWNLGYHDQRLLISIWFKETTLGTRNSTVRRIFAGTFVNLISPRLAASRRSAGLKHLFFFFLFYHFEWEWALKRHASLSVVKNIFFTYILYSIFWGEKWKTVRKKKLWGRALPQSSSIEIVTEVYFHFAEKTKKKKEIIYQKQNKKEQKKNKKNSRLKIYLLEKYPRAMLPES